MSFNQINKILPTACMTCLSESFHNPMKQAAPYYAISTAGGIIGIVHTVALSRWEWNAMEDMLNNTMDNNTGDAFANEYEWLNTDVPAATTCDKAPENMSRDELISTVYDLRCECDHLMDLINAEGLDIDELERKERIRDLSTLITSIEGIDARS